jgi:FAD/FMN-containing dehydrogenase
MAPKTVAPLVLPPGVEQAKFDAFIEKVTSVVGPENVNVVAGSDDLDKTEYLDPSKVHDTFNLFDADYFVSSAVVCPRKVTEVQDLMRLANEFAIPVWPFSIGRNVGYGGAAPRVPGSIGIDMGRHMNRVIEVSEANAYALVEPGVTFSALYEHLETLGLQDKLWLDTPDLGGGSVLGNTSERG